MATQLPTIELPTNSSSGSSSGSSIPTYVLKGYSSQSDYGLAQATGFTSATDYYTATSNGFSDAATYKAASELGYTTYADYQNYLTSYGANVDGVNSAESSDIADTSGVDTSYGSNIDLTPVSFGSLLNNSSQFSTDVKDANNIGSSGVTDEGVITGSGASGTTGDTTVGTAASQAVNNVSSSVDDSYGGNLASESVSGTTEEETTTEDATEDTQMTYAEYLEQIKNNAYQSAKAQQERSIVDANTSYKQNMATYGANAETLASMGLTGSGYSDYINSQAYAQNRSDIQAANATYAQALQDADTSYAANMLDYMNNNNDRYAALLEGANSGTYTASDVESLADTYGLSETQKNALIAAANTYEANKAESDATEHAQNYAYVQTIVTYDMNDTQIEAYGTYYGFSDEQVQALKDYRDELKTTAEAEDTEAEQQGYYDSLIASGYDLSTLSTALNTGKITQEQYDILKSEYQSQIATEYKNNLNSYIANNDTASLSSYLTQLDTDYANGEVTQEAYQEIYTTVEEYIVGALTSGDWDSSSYNNVIAELEDYYNSGKISEDTYNSLSTQAIEYCLTAGLGVDLSAGKSADSVNTSSFGTYYGTGNSSSGQDIYIQKIITAAQNGTLANGTLFQPNYGAKLAATRCWVYYNGKFYQTTVTDYGSNITTTIDDYFS